jgi:broad specificity phosphatase PhoE
MKLWLLRHGAAATLENLVTGQLDPPLADAGRSAIQRLLESSPPAPNRLVSSDLRRARESAEILARHWGVAVEVEPRLCELSFGTWEGRTWEEIAEQDRQRLDDWMARWWEFRAPGGESFHDLRRRAAACAAEWLAVKDADTICVVAHAGSIRAILIELLCIEPQRAFDFPCECGRVTVLEGKGSCWKASQLDRPMLPRRGT